ncbi:MAG: bifunctional metallophosphatase/5'-nucleotidase, partial [Euzebyales bacterium]|nr:bifunctional metallophosphatase/5'-nucleotidase [Euzebyales bacterium]
MQPTAPSRLRLLALPVVALVAALPFVAGPAGATLAATPAPPAPNVAVQVLALNDFHGNLLPASGSGGRIGTTPAGGAEFLATHVERLEATNPHSVVVSAGDLIGASPLLSALFHDEPTIEAMELIGLDINAVGNHEFDEGADELLRMQGGGCHPSDGCAFEGEQFDGADFQFLAANVVRSASGETLLPPYTVKEFDGTKVAFVGMTLEGTPQIVTPSGVRGLEFRDEADTVNAIVPELRRQGVRSIVVLVHEGGVQTAGGGINDCAGISGPIVDIVQRLDDEVDAVITGHTHQAYSCVLDGKPVTSASSFGRLVTDIDLVVNRRSGNVVPDKTRVNNRIVSQDVARNQDVSDLIARYREVAAPLENRVIGSVSGDITRTPNSAGESALGDVIADAQLAATAPDSLGGARIAFMNPGGIRADLVASQISGGEQPDEVTYGEAFTVQPFGNNLVTLTLTGAQIDTLLEQQFQATQNRILQVSEGFGYTWDASKPRGERVDPSTITLDGVTVDPARDYRITVNSFLADGGDGFAVLPQGRDQLGGVVDLDALEAYFKASSPVAPGP